MLTKVERLYGKSDLRLVEFELPKISEEIIWRALSATACASPPTKSHFTATIPLHAESILWITHLAYKEQYGRIRTDCNRRWTSRIFGG